MFDILLERELPRPVGADDPMARLWSYWDTGRAGAAALAHDDFDVVAFRELLGRLNLVNILPGPPTRFRFRLFGTGMDDPVEGDMSGRFVCDIKEPAYADLVQRHYLMAYRLQRPCFWEIKVDIGDLNRFHYCRLTLPMTTVPGGFDMLLVASARYADDFHNRGPFNFDLLGQLKAHRYAGTSPDSVHQWQTDAEPGEKSDE